MDGGQPTTLGVGAHRFEVVFPNLTAQAFTFLHEQLLSALSIHGICTHNVNNTFTGHGECKLIKIVSYVNKYIGGNIFMHISICIGI